MANRTPDGRSDDVVVLDEWIVRVSVRRHLSDVDADRARAAVAAQLTEWAGELARLDVFRSVGVQVDVDQ